MTDTTPMPDDLVELRRRMSVAKRMQARAEVRAGLLCGAPLLLGFVIGGVGAAIAPSGVLTTWAVSLGFGLAILGLVLTRLHVISGADPSAYDPLVDEYRTAIAAHPWTAAELLKPPAESKAEHAARLRFERKIRSTDSKEG